MTSSFFFIDNCMFLYEVKDLDVFYTKLLNKFEKLKQKHINGIFLLYFTY